VSSSGDASSAAWILRVGKETPPDIGTPGSILIARFRASRTGDRAGDDVAEFRLLDDSDGDEALV
jgi:hypothetical protein